MRHVPRKRYGQHFLVDPAIVARIIAAIAPAPGEILVEIGPGHGALTGPLAARSARLHLIEIDRDLAAALAERCDADRVSVHVGDALEFDYDSLPSPFRLVGNLPYNISTPLLFRLAAYADRIRDAHFMLQREVVERLAAAPGGKDYGRLSVMIQYRCAVEPLFGVGPGAFHPRPRVDSTVVRLIPHAAPPVTVADEALLARLVAQAFSRRRKTLRNALEGLVEAEALAALGIDPRRRPETLTLAEFAALADAADPGAR